MNNEQVVDSRPKGAYPLSIGTSLAIESLLGVYPERPVVTPAPLLSAKQVWFNLRTLIRNIISCVPTDQRSLITVPEVVKALKEEIEILQAILTDVSKHAVSCVFYVSHYAHVNDQTFKGATFKVASTPSQKQYNATEEAVLKAFGQNMPSGTILEFSQRIVGKFDRAFILTHIPVDLLDRYRFVKLELIESHTGAIKPFPLWSSKLSGTIKVDLPFNAFTLKVFGDGVHFLGKRPTLKKAVLAQAEADNWTGLTTEDKMRASLQKVPDPAVKAELMELL